MNFASKGDVLSLLHARTSGRGISKSITGKMATVSGHRQRADSRTHPTPKSVATRLRIVASLSPYWTIRGDFNLSDRSIDMTSVGRFPVSLSSPKLPSRNRLSELVLSMFVPVPKFADDPERNVSRSRLCDTLVFAV